MAGLQTANGSSLVIGTTAGTAAEGSALPANIDVADAAARKALTGLALGDVVAEVGEAEVSSITDFGADTAGSTNAKYVVLQDGAGSVGVYNRVAGQSDTPPTADRVVPIDYDADASAATIAAAWQAAIDADAQFSAALADGVLTITDATVGVRTDAADGDTGWTIATVTQGVDASGLKYQVIDPTLVATDAGWTLVGNNNNNNNNFDKLLVGGATDDGTSAMLVNGYLGLQGSGQIKFATDPGPVYFGNFEAPVLGRCGFSVPGKVVNLIDAATGRVMYGEGTADPFPEDESIRVVYKTNMLIDGRITCGKDSLGRLDYEPVVGFGQFSAGAYHQQRLFGFGVATSSTAATDLLYFTTGTATACVVPAEATWAAEVLCYGRQDGGKSGMAKYMVQIERTANATRIVGTVATLLAWQGDAELGTPTWALTADNTNDCLKITVTPANATATRWGARVLACEAMY